MSKKFICTKDKPIVETKEGNIRGYILDDTYTFHGIKYANAKRFMMPTPVDSWLGVKDALVYGDVCPLVNIPKPFNDIMLAQKFWPERERLSIP